MGSEEGLEVAYQVGQKTRVQRVLDQSDFDRFAALSGDDNPIHVDPAFSAQTKFGRTVAHGMLLYSLVCGVLGDQLPGPGTLQLEQELMFPYPTYVGEQVSLQVKVTGLGPGEGLAELSTLLVEPDGHPGLQGRTLVRLPGNPIQFLAPPTHPPTQLSTAASFKGLHLGQKAEMHRAFTDRDLAEYADLSGDTNSLVTDAGYARDLGLAGPLIPGALIGALFSCLLGTRLPGQGTNYLKQRLQFLAPAHPDQALRAVVEIVRLRPAKQLVNLSTLCTNPAGETVCRGEALVLISDVADKR